MVVAFARASLSEVEIYWNMKGLHLFLLYNFYVKMFFLAPLLTTLMPNNLHPSHTMKTTSKVQSEHTQLLHYINISIGNHMILSAIWNKQARVNFFKD